MKKLSFLFVCLVILVGVFVVTGVSTPVYADFFNQSYIVQEGDSAWTIAGKYTGQPSAQHVHELYEANGGPISLVPGQEIRLPFEWPVFLEVPPAILDSGSARPYCGPHVALQHETGGLYIPDTYTTYGDGGTVYDWTLPLGWDHTIYPMGVVVEGDTLSYMAAVPYDQEHAGLYTRDVFRGSDLQWRTVRLPELEAVHFISYYFEDGNHYWFYGWAMYQPLADMVTVVLEGYEIVGTELAHVGHIPQGAAWASLDDLVPGEQLEVVGRWFYQYDIPAAWVAHNYPLGVWKPVGGDLPDLVLKRSTGEYVYISPGNNADAHRILGGECRYGLSAYKVLVGDSLIFDGSRAPTTWEYGTEKIYEFSIPLSENSG